MLACTYALLGWVGFTGLLIALGNVLLPELSRPLTPLVVVGLGAATALAVAAVSLDYFRRVGANDIPAGLLLGVCVTSIGLALDGVLLLATQFDYPNVNTNRTGTLAVLLFLGYAVAAATPPVVAWRRR